MPQPAYDHEHYPLGKTEGDGYRNLVADCRKALEKTGAAALHAFVTAETAAAMAAAVEPVLENAFFKTKTHNCYLVGDDPHLPGDHPRNAKQTTTSATLGYDYIDDDGPLVRLYADSAFKRFIADVLGFDALYPYGDALSPVNVLVYRPGAETGWHFDNALFTVTLLLQAPESGARFEYAPFVRDRDGEFETVGAVMRGASDMILDLEQRPGTLVIFKGAKTLHRVTPVTGDRDRLVAVFSYADTPGKRLDAHTQRTFYGRAA